MEDLLADSSSRWNAKGRAALGSLVTWPDVVSQLPLYNEANVAERLIRATAAMDYPGRHTVQVLDDSADETRVIVDAVAEDLRSRGHLVEVLRRTGHSGLKAGALAYGMNVTDADYFEVSDVDLVPPRDFLTHTLPFFFGDPQAGFSRLTKPAALSTARCMETVEISAPTTSVRSHTHLPICQRLYYLNPEGCDQAFDHLSLQHGLVFTGSGSTHGCISAQLAKQATRNSHGSVKRHISPLRAAPKAARASSPRWVHDSLEFDDCEIIQPQAERVGFFYPSAVSS